MSNKFPLAGVKPRIGKLGRGFYQVSWMGFQIATCSTLARANSYGKRLLAWARRMQNDGTNNFTDNLQQAVGAFLEFAGNPTNRFVPPIESE